MHEFYDDKNGFRLIGLKFLRFGVSEDIIDIGTGSLKFLKILTG